MRCPIEVAGAAKELCPKLLGFKEVRCSPKEERKTLPLVIQLVSESGKSVGLRPRVQHCDLRCLVSQALIVRYIEDVLTTLA